MCADDAHDAYQRGLEILMRHAARLDPDRAAGWLHTVVYRHLGTPALACRDATFGVDRTALCLRPSAAGSCTELPRVLALSPPSNKALLWCAWLRSGIAAGTSR